MQFFYVKMLAYFFLRKINPPRIIAPPIPCKKVKLSPSMIPQATATIGINKVTVDANSGLETLINLYCNIMASPVPKMDKVATNPNPIIFSLVKENSWKKFEKYKANKDGKNKT